MSDRIKIQQQKKITDNHSNPKLATDTSGLRMDTAPGTVSHDISRISLRSPEENELMSEERSAQASFTQAIDRVGDRASHVLGSSDQPLNYSTRGFMEPPFGQDFSHVRVHNNSRATESAPVVNAFGAEQYAPETDADKQPGV